MPDEHFCPPVQSSENGTFEINKVSALQLCCEKVVPVDTKNMPIKCSGVLFFSEIIVIFVYQKIKTCTLSSFYRTKRMRLTVSKQ